MARIYSLAQLTLIDLAPPDLIRVAARTGYLQAGIRLLPVAPGGTAYRLMDEPALLRETLAAIAETGVEIFDLEIIRLDAGFRADDCLPFFEVGARLGARAILVAGDDPDEARLTASFAALCEAAAPFGLTGDLEFMPWTEVPDAASALRIVEAAGQPNGGVLVDALHFGRSQTSLADIAAIPRARLNYAQICDALGPVPTETAALIHTARAERLLPGEGGIDVTGLFAALPDDVPVSVEIPNAARARDLGPERWARAALKVSREAIARSDERRRTA